ncbi:MAG: GGDEF domain-containing protein [Eubacteriales bacterium]|nr:GGDEF domain-containing protein [Eubacteriales bacterium]MDD3881029.1 GGDEF domain-containing protein [Eubacteriales bacterium]MDD4511902.1 GGDEF domain-containing protein [Eubacteriales bacterium]
MSGHNGRLFSSTVFLRMTLCFCVCMVLLLSLALSVFPQDNLYSFSETVITLDDGWTLTADIGEPQQVKLPLTVDYGVNGEYTLTRTLKNEKGLLSSPALCFYSNYVDVSVAIDGETIYDFASKTSAFIGSTGNTYHFVRILDDLDGKTLTIKLRGQLGNSISYLIKPPLLGSKATILKSAVYISLLSIVLSGCMLVLGIGLIILHLVFRKQLSLGPATVFAALFAILFALYVFCETSFAQMLCPNGFALSSFTLTLLTLLPMPLIGLLTDDESGSSKRMPAAVMLICAANFVVQTLLNAMGLVSLRSMVPYTHGIIVISIIVLTVYLLVTNKNKPRLPKKLLEALPMIAGGIADIVLIYVKLPSFNNSFWFSLGVSTFVIIEFCGYIRDFFRLYRASLESALLRDMAYRDSLTGIGNRNAYEYELSEIEKSKDKSSFCSIVLDINDLKLINDTYGHNAGDTAVQETGKMLRELAPASAMCFRTGGDEFVILLPDYNDLKTRELAERIAKEARERGRALSMPLSLAIGFGSYSAQDGSFLEFIRRVDTLMYCSKRTLKKSRSC